MTDVYIFFSDELEDVQQELSETVKELRSTHNLLDKTLSESQQIELKCLLSCQGVRRRAQALPPPGTWDPGPGLYIKRCHKESLA